MKADDIDYGGDDNNPARNALVDRLNHLSMSYREPRLLVTPPSG
jgi:hypothetical protein